MTSLKRRSFMKGLGGLISSAAAASFPFIARAQSAQVATVAGTTGRLPRGVDVFEKAQCFVGSFVEFVTRSG